MKLKIDYNKMLADHDKMIARAKKIICGWHDERCANTHFRAMQERGINVSQTAMNRIANGKQQRLDLALAIEICKEYDRS